MSEVVSQIEIIVRLSPAVMVSARLPSLNNNGGQAVEPDGGINSVEPSTRTLSPFDSAQGDQGTP